MCIARTRPVRPFALIVLIVGPGVLALSFVPLGAVAASAAGGVMLLTEFEGQVAGAYYGPGPIDGNILVKP